MPRLIRLRSRSEAKTNDPGRPWEACVNCHFFGRIRHPDGGRAGVGRHGRRERKGEEQGFLVAGRRRNTQVLQDGLGRGIRDQGRTRARSREPIRRGRREKPEGLVLLLALPPGDVGPGCRDPREAGVRDQGSGDGSKAHDLGPVDRRGWPGVVRHRPDRFQRGGWPSGILRTPGRLGRRGRREASGIRAEGAARSDQPGRSAAITGRSSGLITGRPSEVDPGSLQAPLARHRPGPADPSGPPAIATELVREHGEEAIRLQIDILDGLPEKRRGKIADPAAYLVTAIRNGHAAPKGFVGRAERQAREEARRAKERQEAEDRRRQREQAARERAEQQAVAAYWESLTPEQQAELDAAATAQADPAEVAQEWGAFRKLGQRLRRDQYIRQLLASRATPPAEA